jgi:outer membrane cobalamin receptor
MKYTNAFQYKQFEKKINKGKKNFQSNNATFFNSSWPNKLYFKGSDGWFYEFKNQNYSQIKTQRYEYKLVVSQKHKNISKEKFKTQAQGLKENYQNTFVKSSKKSQTCVFYNYCCHIGHISLDCKLRKENNIINVV